jgi:hypothetical protein
MTTWEHHHPPHDHPDFDAYLDTLTDDDLTAINAAINAAFHTGPTTESPTPDTRHDPPKK